MILCVTSCESGADKLVERNESIDVSELLTRKLEPGDAFVWYLGHSGWAVKTKDHLLIFDYWERIKPDGKRSISIGTIDPEEIQNLKVLVFVSHSHRDHYDPIILEWEKSVNDITYVFGWEAKVADHICFEFKRQKKTIGTVEIHNVVHDFDQIPESAFLLTVDGLVIFYSGDHGSGPPPFRPLFLDNIEYLKKLAPHIDMAFIPMFGEEFYVAEQLGAEMTFPMHEGGREYKYKDFAAECASRKIETNVICAERKGQRFDIKAGELIEN
jgi:L-ascorbate metabolism protein UlaG (beta-lactamase superfamily)